MSPTVSREEFEALQKRVDSMSMGKKEKRTREPTAYNKFTGKESVRIRKENPEMAPKEAFSQAAKNWKYAAENPKREEREVEAPKKEKKSKK